VGEISNQRGKPESVSNGDYIAHTTHIPTHTLDNPLIENYSLKFESVSGSVSVHTLPLTLLTVRERNSRNFLIKREA
jgi:hypothetical protein